MIDFMHFQTSSRRSTRFATSCTSVGTPWRERVRGCSSRESIVPLAVGPLGWPYGPRSVSSCARDDGARTQDGRGGRGRGCQQNNVYFPHTVVVIVI